MNIAGVVELYFAVVVVIVDNVRLWRKLSD